MGKRVGKAIIRHADGIVSAIDRYLEKADKDLIKTLKEEGFADPEGTAECINELEEQIAGALHKQTEVLIQLLKEAEQKKADEKVLRQLLAALLAADTIVQSMQQAVETMFQTEVPTLATLYIKESSGDMMVEALRKRTSAWIQSWSSQLGELTNISTHQQLTGLIEEAITSGISIDDLAKKVLDGGWRNEYYQARRLALTEVLRAHSVAREEAIQQDPATDQKEWRHTGAHKNEPRPNHVEMDGQIVPKDQPFELKGRDGMMYHPMYPRDSILPASEAVNCHCIHRGIPNEEVLGLSYEERKKMQQEIIDQDDEAWKREMNAENKKQAGINEDTVFLDALRQRSKEEQIQYCGGKRKWALVESGVVKDDKDLKKIRTTTLKDLEKDGIFTVKDAALNHSIHGEFTKASKAYPNGRLASGGHAHFSINEMKQRGITCHTTYTFGNGVEVGYVENHKNKNKNGITEMMTDSNGNPGKKDADIGQSWFPADWDEDDIRVAGTYVANCPETVSGAYKVGVYKGVRIGIYEDVKVGIHSPATIFPDNSKQPTTDGWEKVRSNE